jgi:hypothetical protein
MRRGPDSRDGEFAPTDGTEGSGMEWNGMN